MDFVSKPEVERQSNQFAQDWRWAKRPQVYRNATDRSQNIRKQAWEC